jgi:hypothetical protein
MQQRVVCYDRLWWGWGAVIKAFLGPGLVTIVMLTGICVSIKSFINCTPPTY